MSAAAFARRVAVASLPCRVPVLSARTRPFSSTTPAISSWGNSVIPSRSACNAGCVAGQETLRSSAPGGVRSNPRSGVPRARCRARSRSRLSRYSNKVAASPTASARSGAVIRMGGGKRMAKLVVIERQRRAAVPNPAVAGPCESLAVTRRSRNWIATAGSSPSAPAAAVRRLIALFERNIGKRGRRSRRRANSKPF